MNERGDSEHEGDDAAGGEGAGESRAGPPGGDEGGVGPRTEPSEGDDGGVESWSAAAPTPNEGEVPLPWTVVDDDELESEGPEAFEDLRFVGPKTAAALRDSDIDVEDIARKRVSYRDLTERGVHPGVAAKIRREHSLSWSFDAEDADLSRRSSQVRGLDDDERAWVAASSGWSDSGGDDTVAADAAAADGSGDATGAESAWQARPTDGPSDDGDSPTRDGEAAWRERANESPDANGTASEVDDESAWRERAASSASRESETDAEARWREQSAPTPVTALDAVDDEHAARLEEAGIRSIRRLATADPESVADALELDRRRIAEWCEAASARLD